MTTRRKEVDHISWVWGSVPRAPRAHGSPAIKIPFFPLPMIYTVQKLVQLVKDTFPSFIYFPTAPNIRVKPVMWRRNNIDSEPNLFSFLWSSLKKLHWPEVTPIHHILKSNVRRKVNFPLLDLICVNRSENVWLVLRPMQGYPDSTIWEILACRNKNPGKFCSLSLKMACGL